jgi:CBS domain-containing protein
MDKMKVKDVMSRSVRSVHPETKVVEVASLMCLYRFHGLPVVEEDDRLVGIIAERDLLHCLFPSLDKLIAEGMHSVDLDQEMARYSDVLALTTRELMTANPVTVDPEMHVLRAATVMVRHNFRRIPVAHEGRLLGMLSIGDVHKAIFQASVTSGLKGL